MANSKFSAFKLFYDEFIYKQSGFISYSKIDRNIDNIRELTMEIRKTPKYDIDFYTTKLNRINKRIKEQLENIYNLNQAIFEYYHLMYKSRVELSNDSVKDMPFVISCSFYDDYRLDNRSAAELESNPFVIPRYSSLEKKDIRNSAKDKTRLEFFIELLNKSKNKEYYDKFLTKAKYVMNIKPMFNESHYDYFNRIDLYINELEHLYSRLEEKAKMNEDYENISELMLIAYKKRFIDWSSEIKFLIKEYFDSEFSRLQHNSDIKKLFNVGNTLDYESYVDYCSGLEEEKYKYLEVFKSGGEIQIPADVNFRSKADEFKNILMNSYFDKKFKNTITNDSTIQDYVLRAIDLYLLAEEISVGVFEKILYDSSHSNSLKRNNDVNNAIISKIYNLYNPFELFSYYDKTKKEFEDKLNLKDEEFMRKYTPLLIEKKREYDYHGPIPSSNTIKTNVIERRKQFIIDNCITELVSYDLNNQYDTRNYDLSLITQGLSVNDLVNIYREMKICIQNHSWKDKRMQELIVYAAQKFVIEEIFKELKLSVANEEDLINKYETIAKQYLNESLIAKKYEEEDIDKNKVRFERSKDKFEKNSKWNHFINDCDVSR